MIKNYLKVCLFLFLSLNSLGQNIKNDFKNNNNIIQRYIDSAEIYLSNKPAKSSEFLKQALSQLNIEKNDSLKGVTYSLLGKAQYYMANYDSARNDWEFALEIFKNIKFDKGIAEQYNNLGVWYYSAASEYDKALSYYILSLKKREDIDDSIGIAYSLNNIGIIYSNQKRTDKAIENFNRGLLYTKQADDKNIISILLNNLGVEYISKKDYEKALLNYKKAAELNKTLNDRTGLAVTYLNIGSIYKDINKYKEALNYYKKSLEILEKSTDKYNTALIYNYLAAIYKRVNKPDKALFYLNKSLKIAKEINDRIILHDNYREFSEVYGSLNNFKKAYQYQKKYTEYHDSIFNDKSDERMKEMEVRYETEKKDKENEILKRQQKINKLEIEKRKNRQYYLIAGLFLFFLLIVLIYSRYRLKQKTNLILNETNQKLRKSEQSLKEAVMTKDKFFSIIAHDLRNPLSSLSLVSQLLDENIDELPDEKIKYYIGSINNASDELLNLVENLLSWARTQTEKITFSPEIIDLREIIEQNINLLKFNAEKKNIQIKNNINENSIIKADINLLTTVVRNLLSNAVKFTPKNGSIAFNIKNKNEYYEVSIKDSGIGISKEDLSKLFRIDIDTNSIGNSSEKGTGLGLILCKEFTEKNGGTIRAESQPGIGSTFIFTVKKYKNNKNLS